VSVGLSNTSNAGLTPPLAASPGTINAILLVDAALRPSAMVNAVITATEAKTMTLAEWDVRTPQGDPASGTSTDSVVVACTQRGEGLSYAGPATDVGWLVARTMRAAITRLCREKVERDGGRRDGW
jgi:iron complex transport system ATP-binding protein